jgi:hypothetical protein
MVGPNVPLPLHVDPACKRPKRLTHHVKRCAPAPR